MILCPNSNDFCEYFFLLFSFPTMSPAKKTVGFFIPKAFGTSLELTGSPAGAMKVFLVFYIACVFITWVVYGRKTKK